MDKFYREALVGVGGSQAHVVGSDSSFDVGRVADIEGAVGAAEDVDIVHRSLPEEAGTLSEQPFDSP